MMNKIKKMLASDKFIKYIVVIGVAGLLLIMLSGFDVFKTSPNNKIEDDYAEKTEEKLNNIVCSITGEKSVAVMVSLESNGEVIYADAKSISKNNKTDSQSTDKFKTEQTDDSEQNYIIIENEQGGEEALIVTKIAPEVKGVVIVTKYANNSAIAERITSAVATALNISEKRVCVVMSK